MYSCVLDGNNIYLMEEEGVVGELKYTRRDQIIVVDWVSIDPDFNQKLGGEKFDEAKFFNSAFSLLKYIGDSIDKDLNERGKILWGSFPEVRELDDFSRKLDVNKKEIKSKGRR